MKDRKTRSNSMKILLILTLTSVFLLLKSFSFTQSFIPILKLDQTSSMMNSHIKQQADLSLINQHSYPTIGGNWTVMFNTSGEANLTIRAISGTEFGKDIEFLEMRCGDVVLKTELVDDSIFIENYSCNTTSYEVNRILTSGKHILEFKFGDDVEYAYNQAEPPRYSLNSTNSTIAGTAVSHNLFWQDDVGLSHYLFSFDNCTGIMVNDTISQYYNLNFNQEKTVNIKGFNTTSPIYLNSQDGQYYNVTMDYVTKQQIQTYNWTSPDQEPNMKRFNTSATIYPVTYYINTTDTLQQQTGTTQREVLSLTWTPEVGSRYLVLGYLEANSTSTAEQIVVRVFNNTHTLFYWADRPGVANTEILPFQFGIIQVGAGSPVKYNFTIASSSTGTAGAIRARLMAIRIDNLPNTHFNFSYIATEQANVNNVWGDAAGDTDTITISPSTPGWYLIMGFAKLESDSTTGLVSYRLNINNGAEYIPYGIGTASGDFNYSLVYDRNTAEEVSFGVVAVRYFTAGTHTISAQVADGDATASADWQYRSLIVLRLSDVFSWFNASSITQATTTSTSFINYTVLNIPANNAGNYLILGGITIQGSSTSYDHIHQLVVDGVSYNLITERPYNANAYLARMLLQNVSLNENPHWIATQYRTSNSAGTVRVKNSDIIAINLDGLVVPRTEQNSSSQIYDGIDGSDYQNVDKVGAIITIDSYNPSASNSTYGNNYRPDIEVAFYDGSKYSYNTTCQISSYMGSNLLNTTDWNCTIYKTDSALLNAWKLANNRKIAVRALWLDAYNRNIIDEINVTNIYGYVDGWNVTGQDTFRLETEHNTTLSYSGNLVNLTVFIIFTSNVSTTYNLTIYDFNSNSWDYSKCSNGMVTANQFYNWNCTITENVLNYNNSANEVRIRLNQTSVSSIQGEISIDYITYQIMGQDYFPNFLPFDGGTEGWSNVTKIINDTVGCQIRWCVYANDTSGNWNSSSCENPFTYFTTAMNEPPKLGDRIESPSSPTIYSPGAVYTFSIIVNDPQGEGDISTVVFEFDGINETVIDYVVYNSTARNYSVTKTDLAAKPSGYIFKWYANDSQNAWGDVVEGIYVIQKAPSSISILFSNNPVTYPTQTTVTCQKNFGDYSAILTLYRNVTQVSQGSGKSVSENQILGAGVWNYTCSYQESENYTSSVSLDEFLYVNKGVPTLNILLNDIPNYLTVIYPKQTNATAYENNIGDEDVIYNFYRKTSSQDVFIGSGSFVSDVLLLGADVYYYVYNTTGGSNWTSSSLVRVLTINQNTSTIYFMHLTINDTEENKVYTYPALTNVTAWFDAEAFVGEVPVFTLYRNFTPISSSNPVSDVVQLAAGFYNYTYYTPGNQNYSSAIKQFNLTIKKADISPYLHLAINGTEDDAIYTYENVTNVTAWSTLIGQEGITYNLYRNTSTSSILIGSGVLVSETLRLGANTYFYVYNTSGNENYTAGSITRNLTITKKTPINFLYVSPSWTNTYPTETTVTCSIISLNNEVVAQLYRNSSSLNPLPSTMEKTILGAGYHEYVCNSSATENYTASSNSNVMIINKGNPTPYINLYIDNQTLDKTIIYPNIAEIRGNVSFIQGANDLIFNLYRNGILISVGSSTEQTVDFTRLGNGTYIFIFNTSGGANWTSGSSSPRTLYVLKGIVPLHLAINGTEDDAIYTYENVTNVTGWSEVSGEDLQFKLYRNDELKASGSPASEIILLGVGTYTYVFNTSGGANYTSNSTSLTLTITPKQIKIYLALNGTEGNKSYTYPEVINATAWKDSTINNEGSVSLLRDGIVKGLGQVASEIVILGNGTYNYSAIFSAINYTATNILTNRFVFVNKGVPPIFLAINGTQGNVTYTYPSASNATGWLETLNNEGEVELWRNGVIIGKGKIVKEEILLGAGEYNYSLTFSETQNYSSASITQDRFLKINKALSTATLLLEPKSPIIYGVPVTPICLETNLEADGKLWRNYTDVTLENNTAIILPAGVWYYVCNVSETQNYTSAEDSTIYVVNKAASKIRLFLNGSENDVTYTYEDYANITATLNVSDKIFYIESNFTGKNQIITHGTTPLTLITNDFGAGLFNITAYWDGDQNYTGDSQTRFMIVNKKPTTIYLWINGSREDKYFLNESYVNFTVELLGYPGRIVELWTNYTDGYWKKWDYGSSPLQNITQLTKTGIFNFTGNYPGNANYTASYESWTLIVEVLNLESKLESLYPKNIKQGENTTIIGNCSCTGGSCNNVYIEIQANGTIIPNSSESNLQINGSNPYYIGTLNRNWISITWNITAWEAGNYMIRVKCNSTETGDSFSAEEILQVNDTKPPKWFNNFTFPSSPTVYSPGQTYWLNISWLDNVDISTVLIEHNFTGDGFLRNDTMIRDGYDYYFIVKDLPTGIYVFRSYANDTSDNWNKTDSWIYVINKAPTLIRLFLNGSENDKTYNVSDVANFTVLLNVSGKIVHLETNISGWILQSGLTPLFNYTKLNQKGFFNITGYFLGDENYTASAQTYFASVLDVESPRYFQLGQNSSWVGVNKSILLFANWNDNYDLDYAWLATNETGKWENKSVIKLNLKEGQIWSNFTWRNSSIPAGWIIAWRIYANDSSGNENVTEVISFAINASEIWNYMTNGIIFSSPAVGDVNDDASIDVVFASYDKNVYAVLGKNGTKIWNFSTNGIISSSPSLASITSNNFLDVFIGSYDYNLYALNGSDGSKIWNFSTNGKIFSSPAIADVNKDGFLDVVFGSEDGKVYALNGSDGKLLWSYSTNGKVVSSPAVVNLNVYSYPIVFIGSYDYNLYALNGSDGSKIWNFSTREKIESSPAVDDLDLDGNLEVIFGSYDNNIYVLDTSTGEKIWNYTTGNWITSSPVIIKIGNDKKVVISSHDTNIYCLNHDGSINWTFSIPTGGRVPYLPSVADLNLDGINDVVVGATDGRIYVLSGIDGKMLWSYVIGQYIYSSPAIADLNEDGRLDLTFGSTNKYQYALDPPSWACFGGNERRTRIFDNHSPQLLSLRWEEKDGKKILSSLWREKFSNLDYGIVEENSSGQQKIERIKLRSMMDWVNYSFSNTSYYKITVFDEYGNFEKIEGFVEIEKKDSQAPVWFTKNSHVKVNYSKNFEIELNVIWFDESKIEDVIIEHNFTGEFRNESVKKVDENIYSFSVKNLTAGIYTWREHARDIYNNWNSTQFFVLEISKTQPILDFHLSEEVVYPNPVTFNCRILEGDENVRLTLKRNGEIISNGEKVYGEEIVKAGFWNYSCVYPETQNYSHLEITKNVEIRKGFPVLNLLVSYEKNVCPAKVNVTAYENNIGDEDVTYALYEKELINYGNQVNYIDSLKVGNYLFIYNSTEGENWTSGQISRMVVIDDFTPPQNIIFDKKFERGKGLDIYSLWQENCSSLFYGIIEENSIGIFREHKIEMSGNLDWINYTIPEKDLNSENGCRWFLFICFKDIHLNVKVFDLYGNQQKLSDRFTYIFIKPQKIRIWW